MMESFSFRRSSSSGKLHLGYLIQGCRKCLWYLFRNWLFAARFLWMGCHLSIRCFISLLFSKLRWLIYIFPIMLAMRSIIWLFEEFPTFVSSCIACSRCEQFLCVSLRHKRFSVWKQLWLHLHSVLSKSTD